MDSLFPKKLNKKENGMKKILLFVTLLLSVSIADSVLLVEKGWQLMGSSTPIKNMSRFESKNVEQVWHFDATTQKWLGYSPDSEIQTKMNDNSISKLNSLKNWHGFWVKSKQDWALVLESNTLSTAPANENSSNDKIELKKGWNLISLPVDTIISADIFKDMTVWKYNPDREWEFFDKEQSEDGFPIVAHIKNSDGLWVKAENDQNISVVDESSKLHNFASEEEMESFIKEMVLMNNRSYWGIEPFFINGEMTVTRDSETEEADTSASTANAEDASGTNLQESDVDESDIVKHDGTNIFYIVNNQDHYINITTFEQLSSGNSDAIGTISFNDNRYINSMYLTNNRLTVLSYIHGEIKILDDSTTQSYPNYSTQQILLDIYDVSDIDSIKNISSYKIDGNMVNSRVVGDNLYLVSSFSPKASITYPKIYIELSSTCREYFEGSGDYNKYAECHNINRDHDTNKYYRYDYDNPIVEVQDLMPEIESSTMAKQTLIEPSRLYAPSKQNQSATMTTISNISISDGSYKHSNSFIGYSSVQYASSKAFYLVSNQYPIYYDFNNYKDRSMIYKFNLDIELSYRGSGSVYGYALNQFSLSEYNDILRIATTEGFSWNRDGTNNSIYTLKEQDGLLPIQGLLSGLGKENETIKAVRFMGDKAFVVTFEQTDPFYTIDISNPEAPQKVGELQVNGYSAYLHPVGENKILGIGRDADSSGRTQGVKIELFDISDFANPSSLDTIILSQYTYSELEYNHKALAYRTSDNLFAFPYRERSDYQTYNYLGVYKVNDNKLSSYNPIHNPNDNSWGQHRGLIFDMNETTYISFFGNDSIITEELNETIPAD